MPCTISCHAPSRARQTADYWRSMPLVHRDATLSYNAILDAVPPGASREDRARVFAAAREAGAYTGLQRDGAPHHLDLHGLSAGSKWPQPSVAAAPQSPAPACLRTWGLRTWRAHSPLRAQGPPGRRGRRTTCLRAPVKSAVFSLSTGRPLGRRGAASCALVAHRRAGAAAAGAPRRVACAVHVCVSVASLSASAPASSSASSLQLHEATTTLSAPPSLHHPLCTSFFALPSLQCTGV